MANNSGIQLPPSLLREIAKVLAAPITVNGGGRGKPADPYNDYSNVIAGTSLGQQTYKPTLTASQVKSAYGTDFSKLDPKVQAKLNSLYTINQSMSNPSSGGGILHSVLHGGESILNRVGDVLSRGEYAVAEPVKREFNDIVQGKGFGSSVKDMGSGFVAGLTGKDKTLWSNVIQDIVDVKGGADQGLAAKQAVEQAINNPGSLKKAPGWARWGIGLPADIVLDPANLVGAGEVAKVIKAPEMLAHAEELKNAAKSASELGAHANIQKALSLITDEEKGKVADEVRAAMKSENKHFSIGKEGDEKGLVTQLMKTGKYKDGGAAKIAAERIVRANQAEHATRVESKLMDIARDRALEHNTPEELQHDLEAALGLHQDLTTKGWARITRQFRPGRDVKQMSEQQRRATEAIRSIVEAERGQAIHTLRGKLHAVDEADLKPILGEEGIQKAVEDFKKGGQARKDVLYSEHDILHQQRVDKVLRSINMDALPKEMRPHVMEAVSREIAEHPEITRNLSQVTAVKEMMGKAVDENPDLKFAHGLHTPKYKNVRMLAPEMERAMEHIKNETEFLKEHGHREFSVLAKDPIEYAKGVALHELGHVWHSAAGMRTLLGSDGLKDYSEFAPLAKHLRDLFGPADVAKLEKAVGSYGAHFGMGELVAESFAAERMGQGNKFTKAVVDFVEKRAQSNHVLARERQVGQWSKELRPEDIEHALRSRDAAHTAQNVRAVNRAAKKNIAIPKDALKQLEKTSEERAASLESRVHTVLNPEVHRRLGIALRGTNAVVAIPGTGAVVRAGSAIAHADNWFNNAFRASTGVPPEVYQMARSYMGRAQVRIEEQLKGLRDTWGSVSRADAHRAARAWTEGRYGVKNKAGDDLVANISENLGQIQKELETFIPPADILRELDHVLPSQLKFRSNGITSIWKDASKTELKDNWLEDGLREITKKNLSRATPKEKAVVGKYFSDPTNIITSARKATEQAKAFRLLRGDYATELGHPIRKAIKDGKVVPDDVTQTLIDRGYRKIKIPMARMGKEVTPRDLQDMLFAPEVADGITRVYRILNNSSHINDVVTQFDKALRIWKSGVTKFNPGYHERNLFGEVFTSWLGGVNNPKVYRSAMRVLWKHDRRFLDPARVEKANRRAMRAANALMENPAEAAKHLSEAGAYTSKPVLWFHGKPLHEDEVWHLFTQKAGLHTGFISTDLGAGISTGRFGRLSQAIGRVGEGTQTLTEGVEDYARLAHFIHALGKSKFRNLDQAVEEAANEVRKFHHDFQDFTHFETAVMARLVPFYKWTRKNLPLMAETIFTQPGKADKLFTVPAGISYAAGFEQDPGGSRLPLGDPIVPQFLQDNGAVPIGHLGGNTEYLDSPLPLLDALKMANDPVGSSAFMINPALKVLLEEATRHQIGGKQITSQKQYFSTMTPYSNLVAKQGQPEGKLAALLQFISGIGLQENTQKRMLSEAIREQQAAAAKRKQYYKSKGFAQSP